MATGSASEAFAFQCSIVSRGLWNRKAHEMSRALYGVSVLNREPRALEPKLWSDIDADLRCFSAQS